MVEEIKQTLATLASAVLTKDGAIGLIAVVFVASTVYDNYLDTTHSERHLEQQSTLDKERNKILQERNDIARTKLDRGD